MENIKVEVISREIIKPSSPTPLHLKTFNLSLLDQIQHLSYIPLVLFYTADSNGRNIDRSHRLKQSLSEALARFYPLAGRSKENLVIDCNDQGVDYLEARVNAQLLDVLEDPQVGILHKFLPWDMKSPVLESTEALLLVQVNIFDCGGLAIGVSISHEIADATTMSTFVNSWAASARMDVDNITYPSFDASSLFPPKETLRLTPSTASEGVVKVATRLLIFNASSIAALQEKATSSAKPTRFEAIVALILRCKMKATANYKSGSSGISIVMLPLNIRGRMVPPLLKHSFGNLIAAQVLELKKESDWHGLVDQLHASIKEINSDYIESAQSRSDGVLNFLDPNRLRLVPYFSKGQEIEINSFTSWCRMGLYKTDFGWGEPAWVGIATHPYKNMVYLVDTKAGEGIEAWVNLTEEDMVMFEQDPELLEFVSSIRRA